MMIAKYRKAEFPNEWWLTDFTMKQVDGGIANLNRIVEQLKSERDQLKAENDRLRNVIKKVLTYNQGGAWGEDESPDEFMTAALRRED